VSDEKMTNPVTRGELIEALDTWGGALRAEMRGMEQRIIDELRRHTTASAEELRTQVSVVDEQYRDLPGRVTRLEAKVFGPRKRATRRRATRARRP
jgi:hypothetical protein